jgi:hypothetical protein
VGRDLRPPPVEAGSRYIRLRYSSCRRGPGCRRTTRGRHGPSAAGARWIRENRLDLLAHIVEQRIAEAARRGDFDDLPGAGRPVELDDDRLVPQELRAAYRILRNAGYVPEEVQLLAEIGSVERLIAQATRDEDRVAGSARLRLLLDRLGTSRGGSVQSEGYYFDKLVARLEGATPRR